MRLGLLFLLMFAPLVVQEASARQQTFRCSRCGGVLVRCRRCGGFHHANARNQNQFQGQPQIQGGPQFQGQGNGFGGPFQQGNFQQGFPGHMGQQGPFGQFGGQGFRQQAPFPTNQGQIQPASHIQSHQEPEQDLRDVANPTGRQGVQQQVAVGDTPLGVQYAALGDNGKVNQCNGFIAGKHDIGGGKCVYPVGTAEHCLKMKREGMKTQTKEGMENQPFGKEWIRQFKIEGKVFEALSFVRPSAELRKTGDVAIFAIQGSCADFPDSRVYDIDPSPPRNGQAMQFRKSMFWAGIDGTLGYGFMGRAWNAKNIAGRVIRAIATIGAFDQPSIQLTEKGQTTEPGDSGLPVGHDNKISGILSGYPGPPPFNMFFYSPGVHMQWMKDKLAETFGSSIVSKERDPALIASK